MDSVSLFVKSVITITFLWCIAEVILPESKMQKYSSFIYGLIVISLTTSVFVNFDFENLLDNTTSIDTGTYNNQYLKTLYEERLENILIEKFGDDSIDVELTDEYMISNIYCDDKKTYDDIMRYINE